MAVNYSWLQTNVFNIIMDGVSLAEGEEVNGNNSPSKKEEIKKSSSNVKGSNANTIIAGTPSGDYIKLEDLSQKSQNFAKLSDRITLVREWANDTRTSGTLWYDGKVLGFTVEDPIRTVKIYSKTAIPNGNFNITLDTTGNKGLTKCYVTFPGEKSPLSSPGVLPRVGSNKHATLLEAYDLKFAGIRIHNGTSERSSAGCIIYSSSRNKDGTVKNDINHNKALTKLLFENKIKLITVTNEWDNKKNEKK